MRISDWSSDVCSSDLVGAEAEFQVARRRQMHEHLFQVAGDGDLGDRLGQLAVTDQEAGGTAAVIAGDAVDAHADQFGDIDAFPELGRASCRERMWTYV